MPYIDLRNCKIVCDGNSITNGAIYAAAQYNTDYPYQLGFQLNQLGLNVTVVNVGVSGQSTISLTGGAVSAMVTDAVSQVDTLFDPNVVNICIAWEGGNEIYYTEADVNRVQNAYKAMRDYCILRRSKGFYVVVMDNLPRANGFHPGFANVVQYADDLLSYNELIRQNWRDFADSYIDTRKYLPQLLPNNFYMADGVHPTPDGNVLIANTVLNHLRCIPVRNPNKVDFMAQTYKFTTAGAFSLKKPPNTSRVRIKAAGAWAGGGSGTKRPAGTAAGGGGAGSAGAVNEVGLDISTWPVGAVISGVVGAAGIGGASVTANGTNGNSGTSGGVTYAIKGGSGTDYLIYSLGGNQGVGGTTTGGTGGGISTGMSPSVAGASSSITATAGSAGAVNKAGGSGGAGGGISTGNVAFAGGTGGRGNNEFFNARTLTGTGGANTGVAGGNGGFPALDSAQLKDGGGGGGASLTGNGGNGGIPGGGGGAARDGVGNTGKGGDGLPGFIEFTFY